MAIETLKDSQVADTIRRYRERGVTTGGPYTLADLLAEQARRSPSPFGVQETIDAIVATSRASDDGLTTYLAIWNRLTDTPWVGNHAQSQMANALGRVVHHCRAYGMPILTVLVVQSQSRRLTETAQRNIFNEARELGYDVGVDIAAFIAAQRVAALALVRALS